jgi:hypothetical protein
MAIPTKSLADTQKKWTDVTPTRQTEYATNTPAAAQKWEANAIAAAANYQASVSAANIGARQSAGVRRAGAAKFSRKVTQVGANRFGPGVQAAGQDYAQSFSPYLQAIAAIDLPPRRPRGDPSNYQRVQAVGNPLHQLRLAQSSAGV